MRCLRRANSKRKWNMVHNISEVEEKRDKAVRYFIRLLWRLLRLLFTTLSTIRNNGGFSDLGCWS
ncbi:hypothetical protein [Sulfolobus tengchongensis spindle-shaped virus 4]|nr:hypothetical protein [Sulfolobus tengchongensis spindle-shaped virus 4]